LLFKNKKAAVDAFKDNYSYKLSILERPFDVFYRTVERRFIILDIEGGKDIPLIIYMTFHSEAEVVSVVFCIKEAVKLYEEDSMEQK
jgi:hypothetical protein